MSCQVNLEAEVVPQVDMTTFVSFCQGLTIDFENDSYGGTNYLWNFGVAGTTADVSTAFEPSYTFPSAGTYNVQLIVNPGWPCTDTSTETFIINDEIIASFVPPSPNVSPEIVLILPDRDNTRKRHNIYVGVWCNNKS